MQDGTETTQPGATPAPESAVASTPELPKSDFFASGKMLKYAEQAGLLKDEKAPEPAATKTEPAKTDGAPAEASKPFKVISMPDGRKVEVRTEAEFEQLALAGARAAQGGDREQGAFQKLLDKIEKIGQSPKKAEPEQETEAKEEEVDLSLVDPGIRKVIENLQKEVKDLRGTADKAAAFTTKAQLEEAGREIDTMISAAREKNPFEKVVDKADGSDITQEVFTGLVISKANLDQQAGVTDKNLAYYIDWAARRLSAMQGHYKGAASQPLTADAVLKSNPKVYSEIAQAAIAEYLKGNKGAPTPTPARESARMERSSGKGAVSGLADAFKKAAADPSLDLG